MNLDDPGDSTEMPHSLGEYVVVASIGHRPRCLSGHPEEAEPPAAVLEVRIVGGIEGERLAKQQARVMWEVMEWLAQNKS